MGKPGAALDAQGDVGMVVWSLSAVGDEWRNMGTLTALCTVADDTIPTSNWNPASMMFPRYILDPLRWFGPVEMPRRGRSILDTVAQDRPVRPLPVVQRPTRGPWFGEALVFCPNEKLPIRWIWWECAGMGKMVKIQLPPGDRERLTALISNGNASQKYTRRAQILALAGDGVDTDELRRCLGVSKPTIRRWRARYVEAGVDGLCRDKTHSWASSC